MPNQRAGVDLGGHRNVALGQKLLGLLLGAPVARNARKFAHNQAFDDGAGRFAIIVIRAVVADLGIGEDHDLAGVRRVREDFLVAGDRGIENNLAGFIGERTKATTLEDRAVLQGERCGIQ